MSEKMIKPTICAVCGQVLERTIRNDEIEYLHATELTGNSDHPAVPTPYGSVPRVTRCDFCHRVTPLDKQWTVPAESFRMPLVKHVSVGGWCACSDCAPLVTDRNWEVVADRYFASPETSISSSDEGAETIRYFLLQMYQLLEQHMLGEPRPWQAGDEDVPETPPTHLAEE